MLYDPAILLFIAYLRKTLLSTKKVRKFQMTIHRGNRKSWFIQMKECYAALRVGELILVCNFR